MTCLEMLIMRLLKASINLRWSLSFRKCSVLICNRLSWNTEKFNTNNEVASPVFLVSGSRCAGLKHIIVTYYSLYCLMGHLCCLEEGMKWGLQEKHSLSTQQWVAVSQAPLKYEPSNSVASMNFQKVQAVADKII